MRLQEIKLHERVKHTNIDRIKQTTTQIPEHRGSRRILHHSKIGTNNVINETSPSNDPDLIVLIWLDDTSLCGVRLIITVLIDSALTDIEA